MQATLWLKTDAGVLITSRTFQPGHGGTAASGRVRDLGHPVGVGAQVAQEVVGRQQW